MTDESLKEEILINVTSSEVRAALLENGVLQEVYIERAARRGLISNIYKGRVLRVLPGMQAAFIDIGLERTAFLHASDIARRGVAENGDDIPAIRDLVREGDEIMVQVVKDPLGNKGARLTTYITLPSRHLVLLPRSDTVGISARIEDEEEREGSAGDPLVVASEHPLSRKQNVQLQDLARHAAILPASNTYTRQIAEQAFSKLGLEIDIALSTNYMETIKMLVSVGIGWSILPQTMLDKNVRKLAVKEVALQRSLGIVYHRDRTLSNAAIALSKLLGHA